MSSAVRLWPDWPAIVARVLLLGTVRVAWLGGGKLELLEAPDEARARLAGAPSHVLLQAAGVAPAVARRAVKARIRREAGLPLLGHGPGCCVACEAPPTRGAWCDYCEDAEELARQDEPAPALPVVAALDVEPEALPPTPAPLPEALAEALRRMKASIPPSADVAPAPEMAPTRPVARAPERRRRGASRAREVAPLTPRSRFARLARLAPRRPWLDADE